MPAEHVDVVVVGAGPTGLSAAAQLHRHGARVRVVERNHAPSVHSKALVVQPRTLEVLAAMGVADAVMAEGQPVFSMQMHVGDKHPPQIRFEDVDGPFARPVMLRQSRTERLLGALLEREGVAIEWGVGLEDFRADDDGVELTLSTGERLRAAYLVGCDGAHSLVRKRLGVAFEGSTYENDFLQADCKVRWDYPEGLGQGFLRDDGALVCLPLGGDNYRFILIRRERPADAPDEPALAEFQAVLDQEVPGAELHDPEWLIRFRLHERIAARFRVGRVFLAGDAAHIHTPAGGQGMNIGIQDAYNLAWKLGLVLRGHAGEALLDSYHAERHPVAAKVLRFTDILFRTALGSSALVRKLRPLLISLVFGSRFARTKMTRTVAQLEIDYRDSPIVEDHALFSAGPRAGDRAPDARLIDADGRERRVFELLRGTEHVLFTHCVHTNVLTRLRRELPEALVRIVVAPVGDEGEELEERYHLGGGPAIWVVRPDGHLGYRQSGDDAEPVLGWFRRVLEGGF